MKNLFITALLFLAAMTAQAQDTRSEFFYQANEGEKFVEGHLGSSSLTHDFNNGDEAKLTDMTVKASFEMGLTEMYSVYGNISYGSGKYDIAGGDTDLKGLYPINLGTKMKMTLGSGALFAKANVGLGFLGGELDCSGNECNRTTDSIDLSLRIGYLLNLENAFAGLALNYGLFSTDIKVKGLPDIDAKGGFNLTAFYEAILSNMILGGALIYTRAGLSEIPQFGDFYPDVNNADVNIISLKAYTRVPISENMSVLGSLIYDGHIDQANDALDGGSGFGANLGLRVSL